MLRLQWKEPGNATPVNDVVNGIEDSPTNVERRSSTMAAGLLIFFLLTAPQRIARLQRRVKHARRRL
jgi:hypothetical protein